jgi:predicted acylesterase/phospholipase RssA
VAVPEGEVGPRPQREFAGVFEGGGAKGIAYVGALEAVEERGGSVGRGDYRVPRCVRHAVERAEDRDAQGP